MKAITTEELEKIVNKAEVEPIEGRKGYLNVLVDFGNDFTKSIAVKSDDPKDAKTQAVEIIVNEPEGIRQFKLKDAK